MPTLVMIISADDDNPDERIVWRLDDVDAMEMHPSGGWIGFVSYAKPSVGVKLGLPGRKGWVRVPRDVDYVELREET